MRRGGTAQALPSRRMLSAADGGVVEKRGPALNTGIGGAHWGPTAYLTSDHLPLTTSISTTAFGS